jgi:heme oxygenase
LSQTSRRWLLRDSTAQAHAALDAAVGALDTLEDYHAYLRASARFRAPLEQRLGELAWPNTFAGWRPRAVAGAIAQDLADLGLGADLPPADLPLLAGDRLFGALYVLQGSSLGARLLFDRARDLGLSAGHGARHLALLSGGIDDWRAFLAHLDAVEPLDLPLAISGAVATFAFATWAFSGAAAHG